MLVLVLNNNLLDYATNTLNNVLGVDFYKILYNSTPDSTHSTYWHMTCASVKLQEYLIYNSATAIDLINTPVLVIFDRFDHVKSIISKSVNTDTVYFDTLHCNYSPAVMYGSIVAISKSLKSAVKIEDFLKDSCNKIVKTPFNNPSNSLFQLIWYTQRIGLKIYEYNE